MKKSFPKFVSLFLSFMICIAMVPHSFATTDNVTEGSVTPKIAAGENHTFILKSDGTVWATGYNDKGQLGVGDINDRNTFTQCVDARGHITGATDLACGTNHTAIIRNGEVWQCGNNSDGQLGNTNTPSDNYSKVFVKSLMYTNGSDGDTEAITKAKQVSCGSIHTAIIRDDGEVWQCGSNSYGQLGSNSIDKSTAFMKSSRYKNGSDGDIESITKAIQIACGGWHTAIIVKDDIEGDEVWQCGYNNHGQLGNNSTTDSKVFVRSSRYKNGSDGDTETITGATQIACGGYHTAIISGSKREVWQCGNNSDGELGNNSTEDSKVFVKGSRYKNGSVGDTETITEAKQIACGKYNTSVFFDSGEIWQCGSNSNGQLGNNSTEDSKVFIKSLNITNAIALSTGVKSDHTMAVCKESDGTYTLYSVGNNNKGQLGLGYIGNNDTENSLDYITTFSVTSFSMVLIPEYIVDIEWGKLEYKYNATWDVEGQKWGEGSWIPANDGDDKVVVKSYSTIPCDVGFNFTASPEFKKAPGTEGTFDEDSKIKNEPKLNTETNVVTLGLQSADSVANQKTVLLKLKGIPDIRLGQDTEIEEVIGTVTVTIEGT